MATGSFMTPIYSRSQSEVQGDLHNGAQRINPENRVGSSFRIIPEQFFSGVENIDDFLENIDHNLAYYEIPAKLACAYLKGHRKGRALDWFEVLGYRVIEDKTTDYAHLKQALSEQFPVVRNPSHPTARTLRFPCVWSPEKTSERETLQLGRRTQGRCKGLGLVTATENLEKRYR
ncbi:uncharacterized protein TNCV_645191 [Trichonephila clavipes]|nr:uncharacterized protein TNCV_645191 [Trichonephila clavipes]